MSLLLDWVLPRPQHPTLNAPGLHLRWRWGWLKAWFLRPYWSLLHVIGVAPRVRYGKRFSVMGRWVPRGPGLIIVGDDVIVGAVTTPFTHSREAVIRIGNRVFLNGTRFGASQSIEVGDDCILADARIMDTDFHSTALNRNQPSARVEIAPVRIHNNVWIAASAALLKGVEVGEGSVIGFGAIVTRSIPSGVIAFGNPAQVVKSLEAPDA